MARSGFVFPLIGLIENHKCKSLSGFQPMISSICPNEMAEVSTKDYNMSDDNTKPEDQTDEQTAEAVEFLKTMLETQGVACSTVKDGHVLLFKRSLLEAVLNANPDKQEFMMFVKRPDFQN